MFNKSPLFTTHKLINSLRNRNMLLSNLGRRAMNRICRIFFLFVLAAVGPKRAANTLKEVRAYAALLEKF